MGLLAAAKIRLSHKRARYNLVPFMKAFLLDVQNKVCILGHTIRLCNSDNISLFLVAIVVVTHVGMINVENYYLLDV